MSFFLVILLTLNTWTMMSPCDHSHAEYEDEQHIECVAHQDLSHKSSQSKSSHANHSGCLKFCCHFMPICTSQSMGVVSAVDMRLIINQFVYILGHEKNHIDQILRPPIV